MHGHERNPTECGQQTTQRFINDTNDQEANGRDYLQPIDDRRPPRQMITLRTVEGLAEPEGTKADDLTLCTVEKDCKEVNDGTLHIAEWTRQVRT